jgi:DNA-binding response OmpR family regulator
MAETATSTLMIVEDDTSFIYLVQRFAEKSGFRLVSTTLADKALMLAQCERPVLIILDIGLSGKNGWEVLRELKADDLTRGIPVLMCSGLDEVTQGREKGADAYLQKPVRYQDFLGALMDIGVMPHA